MKTLLASSVGLISAVLIYGQTAPRAPQPTSTANPSGSAQAVVSQKAVIDQYCVGCHNEKTKTAGLTLQNMDLSKVGDNAEIWEKVVRKLRVLVLFTVHRYHLINFAFTAILVSGEFSRSLTPIDCESYNKSHMLSSHMRWESADRLYDLVLTPERARLRFAPIGWQALRGHRALRVNR